MKIKLLLILIPSILFGQKRNDSLIAKLYNITLTEYFSDTITYGQESKHKFTLIKTEIDKTKLIQNVGNKKFMFFENDNDLYEIVNRPYKSNRNRAVYSLSHKNISNDTIDVNISGRTLENITRRRLYLSLWCGGTMGYIPDARFIYDFDKKDWTFISREEITKQKEESRAPIII